MLARQVGGIGNPYTVEENQQVLIDAAGGGIQAVYIPPPDASPSPITPDPQALPNPVQLNLDTPPNSTAAVVTATATPGVATVTPGVNTPPAAATPPDYYPWLWAGLGVGAAYLLSRGDHQVAGTLGVKRGSMAPLLLVGGAAVALYLFTKPAAVVAPAPVQSTLPTSGGGSGGPVLTMPQPTF